MASICSKLHIPVKHVTDKTPFEHSITIDNTGTVN